MEIASDGSGPSAVPERRYLTIVFCDLVGSTELSERLDPEDLRDLQLRYQRSALTAMENYGGFVASHSGDGILVYFGYPAAHESDAERAVRAALELIELVPTLETKLAHGSHPPLAVRIGVHTGLVVIGPEMISTGRQEHSVVGEAANLASRLQAEAPINSIVVTKETLELIEGLFEYEPLGEKRIRGLSRTVAVYRIIRARYAASRTHARLRRGATRMVGREQELERLLSAWRQTTRDSRCTMVQVVGEAGVGKTRLVRELCQRPELAGGTVLPMNCLELFASTPLYPVASFFWVRLGLIAEDDEAARIRKISAYLDGFRANTPENVAILASLLGLALTVARKAIPPTPLMVKREQFALLILLIARLARKKPTLLWIEDAHWLDPSSAELLPEIIEHVADAPMLVLLTLRSFPKGPALPAPDQVIHLEQLEREECLELARSVPGAQAVAEELLTRAAEASDGIPLFIEQLVLSLINQSAHASGKGSAPGGLPLTLGEMMSERLDRLEGGRRVVQAGACIGRSFAADFLGALLDESGVRVIEPLEALVGAEILRRRRDGATTTYEFRHALLQRVGYESMIQPDRRAIHARIAEVLKQRSNSEPVIPEVMAHHLTAAGRSHEAINAWLEAAASASRRSAVVEAIAHLRRGLGLLEGIPKLEVRRQLELSLLAALIGPLTGTQDASDEVSACCERGMELSMAGEPTPLVFPFMFGQFTFALGRGRIREAVSLSERFLSLAVRDSYDSGRVVGHRLAGMALLHEGEVLKAKEHFERSLELYSPERDEAATYMFGQNTQIHSRCLLSVTLFCLGQVDQAFQVAFEALRAAEALRHAHSTALALSYVGLIVGLCGATEPLMRAARRQIAISEQHRLGAFRTMGKAFLGWALCLRGDLEQGIAVMKESIAAFDAAHNSRILSGHLAILADAQRRSGQLHGAEAVCARAVQMISSGADARFLEPEVCRIEALIARDLHPQEPTRAETILRHAVECAQRFGLAVFELRCLLDLASLLGPTRREVGVDSRIEELSHLRDIDRRAATAMRIGAPGLDLDGS